MKTKLLERITRHFAPLTRTFAMLLAVCATTSAWADTLRVLGSDATICSSATTLDQLGIGMSEGKVAGKINFYTPAGCSAGDTLVFTKVEMLESTGNTANAKQEATTITITVGGQNYTSDVVIKSSTAPSSLGNLTTAGIASCKLLTYNFPDVFVQAGEQYDVTFNGANFSELRCRMENTSSGTVFTAPTSGVWKPYGVITVAPVKSSNPDVGDTILLSNTATSGELQASPNAECNFALTIPATPVLPSGATINVKKLNFASWNDTMVKSGSSQCDPYGIYLNGQRSKNLKGNTTYSSDPGTIDLTGAKIQANATTYANRLSFAFVDGYIPQLTVGTAYAQASGNGDKGYAGKGITFLHYNGNQNSGGPTDYCSVRYVSADSGAISTSTASGYYPVYEMYAEVISIPTATNTISVAGTYTLADLFTAVYDNRRYVIIVNESATLNLDASVGVKSIAFEVASGKTLTVSGDYTITAADGIYVSGGTVAVSKKDTLSGAFRGDGTVEFTGVYATPLNLTDKGVTDASAWQGTLAFKSVSSKSGWQFSQLGNANSTVRFDGVTDGYFNATESFGGTVDIASGGLKLHYANAAMVTTIAKLTGSGNFTIDGGSSSGAGVVFQDASGYAGAVTLGSGCNQQVTFGSSGTSGTSAKIIIASDASVTPGATWAAAGGIEVNGTLTLNSTIGMPAVAGGAGTIICNQKVPNNDGLLNSTWKGTLKINGDVGDNANTKIGNSASTLEIATGSVTLTDVTILPGRTVIDSGATLNIANTGVTEFTLGAVENSGTLDLSGCTSLTTLNFDIGKNRTVDLGLYGTTFKVPLSSESVGTVTLVEMPSEGGTIRINSALLPAFGPTYSITYADGTALTPISTSVSGSVTSFTYTPHISGVATDLDWDFTDGTDDALEQAPSGVSKNSDSTMTFYVDAEDSTYTGVYLKHHPYVDGAATFIHNNSSAITVAAVGTMPSGSKNIFMNFGSAYANKYGLLLANTEVANEVLVAYNYGATVTPITTMTVPNATTARHSYIITKEDSDSSTTFTVYLDGIKWKTVTTNFKIEFSNTNTGIQFGSDFGGNIRTAGYPAVSDDTGILNVLRVYGRIVTPAEIAAYASTFPYVSPSGSSSRTFAAAAENWIDTTESSTVWDNSSEDDSGTPAEGASVTVTASADTTITVNLAALTGYESLTINGSSVKFTPASASSGAIKVTGMTVVGTAVTNVYGAVDMAGGPMTLTEDGDITFDCSAYDISDIYTTTDVNLTGDVDENSTRVHLIAPSAEYRTASLVYTSRHYVMRITPAHEAGSDLYYAGGYWGDNTFAVTNASGTASVIFPGDVVVIPAYHDGTSAYFGATLPANVTAIRVEKDFTFESGVDSTAILGGATVTVADGCTLSFATSWHNLTLGAVTINGDGAVILSGAMTLGGVVDGTAAVTVDGTISVGAGGSIDNTISGSGTVAYAALPTSALSFSDWTGTVVLPAITSDGINFNNYGVAGSTVYLTSMSGAWIDPDHTTIDPKLYLAGNMTLTAMSTRDYIFAEIDGTGNLSFATVEGTPTVKITKVAKGYSGTISSTLANPVTITTLDRTTETSTEVGDKLLTTSGDVRASTVGKAGTPLDIFTKTESDGIYVAAGYSTETTTEGEVKAVSGAPTELTLSGVDDVVAIPASVTKVVGGTQENLRLIVTYTPEGGSSTTCYYPILKLDSSGNVSLNEVALVNGVTVTPVVDTSAEKPMDVSDVTAPTFKVKAIPGLWYKVVTGTSMSEDNLDGTPGAGTAIQAVDTTVSPVAPAFSGTVQYYKIAVGTTSGM